MLMAWRVLENKLATRVNLSRRGVQLESLRCVLCGKEEESGSHLFFGCSFAWRVWCLCYRWLGVLFVSHIEPKFNFDQFRLSLSSETGLVVWNTIWVGVVSEIWSHRNHIIFKRGVAYASEVFALVQVKVWSWVSTNSRLVSFSYSDWCLEPMECMRLVSWSFFFLLGHVRARFVLLVLAICSWNWYCVICIRVEPPLKWF